MILNGDFMILNDELCIEKNQKQKKNNFPIFSFLDMVDFKCEKCGQIFFSSPISIKKILSAIQTILRKENCKVKKKKIWWKKCWDFLLKCRWARTCSH